MTSDANFNLGDKVTFTSTLLRQRASLVGADEETVLALAAEDVSPSLLNVRVWVDSPLGKTLTGIITGVRTLSDGYIPSLVSAEDDVYIPVRHFTAWDVVTDLYHEPRLVLNPVAVDE